MDMYCDFMVGSWWNHCDFKLMYGGFTNTNRMFFTRDLTLMGFFVWGYDGIKQGNDGTLLSLHAALAWLPAPMPRPFPSILTWE